ISAVFYSTNSQPKLGVKEYEEADRQKVEILEENKEKTGIYMWINKINGKRYVGSAKNLKSRLLVYYNYKKLQENMSINKALLKYGYASFSFIVLEYCSQEVLVQREQHYLDLLQPEYNILVYAYSSLGFKHDKDTLYKMSAENNHFFGKTHSEEARAKMQDSKIGKNLSEETKAKISAATKGRGKNFTEEHKKNISAAQPNSQQLSVLDLETGVETVYHSIGEAARSLGLLLDSMRANLISRQSKPYKARYVLKRVTPSATKTENTLAEGGQANVPAVHPNSQRLSVLDLETGVET